MEVCLENIIENSKNIPLPKAPSELLYEKRLIIYGAGSGGCMLHDMLQSDGIYTECFLDRNAKEGEVICGIPKYIPEYNGFSQREKKEIFVIIAVWDWREHDKIFYILRESGYEHFIMFNEITYYYLGADNSIAGKVGYDYYNNNKKDILKAEKLFKETLSCEIYIQNIKSYVEHDFKQFYPKMDGIQYFPDNIELFKGYDRFIDCGAYTGDTIEQLYKLKGKINTIAAFEPQKENFNTLSKMLSTNEYADKIAAFPCGVWSDNKQLHFSNVSNSTFSTVSNAGECIIQCLRMDDALYGFNPTFIKMDIEGSELDALYGARRIIAESEPDLAICVYHSANHIWDIPLFIASINPNYKFYLRTHGHFGIETVLYATVSK